jgi:hypothetical protein
VKPVQVKVKVATASVKATPPVAVSVKPVQAPVPAAKPAQAAPIAKPV